MMDDASVTPPSATGTVRIEHEVGLHARPSVKLTQLAKTFAAKIEFATSQEGPWIDAKSIVKVMGSKTPNGALMHFRAEGTDAVAAVQALVSLVERDFDLRTPDA
jgi:phosphocarrier protein HPr